ncbi:MAG: glycerol-3-phosphate responsive antiterminator [Candidatus Merdivicinus sp.]|jgi:glycerol uptake operon antiterminator
MNRLLDRLEQSPVIAAVRQRSEIVHAAKSPCEVVFLLCGEILTIQEDVALLHQADKLVFIHTDLLGGIGRDAPAIEFLAKSVQPDGIISTRSQLIRCAKERGLLTVQRFFLLDSQSAATTAETAAASRPDMAEIMPGICPRIIQALHHQMRIPLIAGGMISEKEDIFAALSAGAAGVSTSSKLLWNI